MLARLAGLAVLIPCAVVGLTAQLVIAPWAYLLELQRVRTDAVTVPFDKLPPLRRREAA